MAKQVPQIPIESPNRRRNIVICVCVVLVLLFVASLLVDANEYLGGVTHQIAIIDHDQRVVSGGLGTTPPDDVPLSVTFGPLDYHNLQTGRRVNITEVQFGRIKLGMRVTVKSKENQITRQFFVSRWSIDPVTCDAGDQLKVIIQDIRLPPVGEIGK